MENVRKTIRNRITRMKIGETIVRLLDQTSLAEIQVAAISRLAGISRMTFYHYYETKEEALKDYLTEIIYLYRQETAAYAFREGFCSVERLAFAIDFFSAYDRLILKLEKVGCYKFIVDSVNDYFEKEYRDRFQASVYQMYFYSGAIINVFLQWIHGGKKESPQAVAAACFALLK